MGMLIMLSESKPAYEPWNGVLSVEPAERLDRQSKMELRARGSGS